MKTRLLRGRSAPPSSRKSPIAAPLLGLLLLPALLAAPLAGQSAQPWSFQGSLLGASQDIGGTLIGGAGIEAQLRYTPVSLWSLGGGFQWSSHTSGQDTLELTGVFLEPRYTVDIGSDRVAPYLAGRLAVLNQSSTLAGLEFSSNGAAAGGGGGLLFRATPRMNLDVGAAVLWQSLEDAEGVGGALVVFDSFIGYVVKAGVSIGFGSR